MKSMYCKFQARSQGGTPGNFSWGPHPQGGPGGAHPKEKIFFFNFNEGKNQTFWNFSGYKVKLLELSKGYWALWFPLGPFIVHLGL